MRVLTVPRGDLDPEAALDRLLRLGPADVAETPEGLQALFAESPSLDDEVARVLGLAPDRLRWSPPLLRDGGTTALLEVRPHYVAGLWLTPVVDGASPPDPALDVLLLRDSPVFGSGAHPTTVLCLEALAELPPAPRVLDVGTGNGVLALAALRLGAGVAVGVDTDPLAVDEARANATRNALADRFTAKLSGPDAGLGRAPLVVANILAAPLQVLAPAIAGLVASDGDLLLSGIPAGVAEEVTRAYLHVGMRRGPVRTRGGWSCLHLRAGW